MFHLGGDISVATEWWMRLRTKVADRGPAIAPGEYVTSLTLRNLELFDARHIDNIIHKTIVKKLEICDKYRLQYGNLSREIARDAIGLEVAIPFNLKSRVLVGLLVV
jgi:hypothetical protein